MQSARIGQNRSGAGPGAGLWRSFREMGFGIRAMVQELSGTLDALQDKPEPIGHALELQESQKNTFPGYLLAERIFPAICLQRGISDSRPVQLEVRPWSRSLSGTRCTPGQAGTHLPRL